MSNVINRVKHIVGMWGSGYHPAMQGAYIMTTYDLIESLEKKRKPLTATQIDKIFNSQLKEYGQLCDKSDFELFASSIEKAHGIGVDNE